METKVREYKTPFKVVLLQIKIKELWEQGDSIKQIALKCNRSMVSICKFMKKLGLNPKQKIYESELKIIKESLTQVEAAEKLCITPAGVNIKIRRFKQLGLM